MSNSNFYMEPQVGHAGIPREGDPLAEAKIETPIAVRLAMYLGLGGLALGMISNMILIGYQVPRLGSYYSGDAAGQIFFLALNVIWICILAIFLVVATKGYSWARVVSVVGSGLTIFAFILYFVLLVAVVVEQEFRGVVVAIPATIGTGLYISSGVLLLVRMSNLWFQASRINRKKEDHQLLMQMTVRS